MEAPTPQQKQIEHLRYSIGMFQKLRNRAKCQTLKRRYNTLISKYRQAEQKLLNKENQHAPI